MATITIDLAEFDALRALTAEQATTIAELRTAPAPLAPRPGDVEATILLLLHNATTIASFAVANTPPEVVAGWPHAQLDNFAAQLEELSPAMPYNAQQRYAPIAEIYREFAREAARCENARAQRAAASPTTRATRVDFGPKTEEAAALHALHVTDQDQ